MTFRVPIADTIIDSGICGYSANWTLYTDGSLVIDGEGNTFLYSEKNPSPWYKYASQITSVAFKEGMQWVNSGFLEGLEYVTKISFSHTMQLVGATNGFIRRPFIMGNLWSGVIAATLASVILIAVRSYIAAYEFPLLNRYLSWENVGLIVVGLFIFGAVICSVAALFATTKYLRQDYDQLFK